MEESQRGGDGAEDRGDKHLALALALCEEVRRRLRVRARASSQEPAAGHHRLKGVTAFEIVPHTWQSSMTRCTAVRSAKTAQNVRRCGWAPIFDPMQINRSRDTSIARVRRNLRTLCGVWMSGGEMLEGRDGMLAFWSLGALQGSP